MCFVVGHGERIERLDPRVDRVASAGLDVDGLHRPTPGAERPQRHSVDFLGTLDLRSVREVCDGARVIGRNALESAAGQNSQVAAGVEHRQVAVGQPAHVPAQVELVVPTWRPVRRCTLLL